MIDTSEHALLIYCIECVLFEISPPKKSIEDRMSAKSIFNNLFDGPGRDGEAAVTWEICRWKDREKGEAGNLIGDFKSDDFLAWTGEGSPYDPQWQVYDEANFKKIFAYCCRSFVTERPERKEEFSDALAEHGMKFPE